MTSCVAQGIKVDQEKLTRFEVGKTTYTEVLLQLGTPTSSTLNSDGTRQALYSYTQQQASWQNFVPFGNLIAGGSSAEQTNVVLDFDERSILRQYSATQGQIQSGHGLATGGRQP
jgi:outer membrane protein assembly factor BamE (lipoprotein component of BamABCDE complex)